MNSRPQSRRKARAGTLFCLAAAACAVALLVPACEKTDGNASLAETQAAADFFSEFPIKLGEKTLSLRLALTDLERQRGLTGCRGLRGNAGMLFAYADANRRAFWMRGVPVNLSIGFFDADGNLLETREMFAEDLETTVSRSGNVKFALEMRAGWFAENSVAPGAKLDLAALANAIRSRGFSFETPRK